jgi:transcriptional regulator CtsR
VNHSGTGGDVLRNISDIIEQHLKRILQESPNGFVEIQRSELADLFQCVPSQINYVINTRFTVEKGYIVESKRGGGGYIRIRKVQIVSKARLQELLTEELIGESIAQGVGYAIIDRLLEEGLINNREATLMKIATSRSVLTVDAELRDRLRANMLKQMIASILLK